MLNSCYEFPLSEFIVQCSHPLAHTIFQNQEDYEFFLNNRMVESDRCTVIRGSGADCQKFKPSGNRHPGVCVFFRIAADPGKRD